MWPGLRQGTSNVGGKGEMRLGKRGRAGNGWRKGREKKNIG
jgi:hypothetical protein